MSLTKAPSNTAHLSREELEQLVSDLRRQVTRLRGVINARQHRANARLADRTFVKRIDGRPLQAARLAVGWVQDDLAKALGVTKNTVCHWETGRNRIPEHHARSIVKMFADTGVAPPLFDLPPQHKATKRKAP